jgi:LPS sulfotransferase NodH
MERKEDRLMNSKTDQPTGDAPTSRLRAAYHRIVPESVRRARITFIDSRFYQLVVTYLRLLAFWTGEAGTRFLIFTQGRTGGQLLVDLLNASPEVHCEHEILHYWVPFPKLFVKGRCLLSKADVYGFRVKIFELTKAQRVSDPKRFLADLNARGWKIIYLKRENILRQAVSYLVALDRGTYQHRLSNGPVIINKVDVDCNQLMDLLDVRAERHRKEAQILADIEHTTVLYERDLLRAETHQATLDRLLDYLGVPRALVKTDRVRTGTDALSDSITNFDEVGQFLAGTEYAPLLYAE